MRRFSLLPGSLLLAAFLALTACSTSPRNAPRGSGGSAQVEFVNPKEFTDFTGSGPSGRADEPRMLADLEKFIQTEAARQLAADRRLAVRILDIDQGGGIAGGPRRVRVTGSHASAEIRLEYVLSDNKGQQVATGKSQLVEGATSLAPTESTDKMPLLQKALRTWLREIGTK